MQYVYLQLYVENEAITFFKLSERNVGMSIEKAG